MNGEKVKLSETEILAHSQTLNTASQSINDTCKKIYDIITRLQEDEAFKSKDAAVNYYMRIQELNAQVPKFTEGVLKFSKFLSGYLIENYAETDELAKQIQDSFNDSVNQLAMIGLIGGVVSIDKISSTAQGALNGNFISSDKIYKEAFEDTGSLEFVTREDGAIMITRDGVPIGFTTQDGISNPTTSEISKSAGMENDPRYKQSEPSGMENDPRYKNIRPETPLTEGMGNNQSIIKARESGILKDIEPQYTDSQKQYLDFQNSRVDSYVKKDKNLPDSLWNQYIGKDISATRTENKINAIHSETEKILSGNGGLASEIIEKGSVPFPENAILRKPGFDLSNMGTSSHYKELRYNGTTGKVDVILKDGTTSVSYNVDDLIGASWK